MSAHVGLDKSRTRAFDNLAEHRSQFLPGDRILDEREVGGGLTITVAHYDDAMFREAHSFSEGEAFLESGYNGVREIGVGRCMMPDEFQGRLLIDENDDLTLERAERDMGMRAEAALAGQTDPKVWPLRKGRLNLGTRSIQL